MTLTTLAMALEEGYVELQASQDVVITVDDRAEAANLAALARWARANPAGREVVRLVDTLLAHDARENRKHRKQRELAGWLAATNFRPELVDN